MKQITETLEKSSTVVLVDYAGMGVGMQEELRRALREVDATMRIIKNTLFRIAGENAKAPKEISDTVVDGPSAMVYTQGDPIAPLQVLGKFAKENELPHFKVGIVEGNYQNQVALIALSKLPSKDMLVAQAVGAIAAPLYGFVSVLNAPMQKLVFILDEYSKSETSGTKSTPTSLDGSASGGRGETK